MKKLAKQIVGYSFLFGAAAILAPVAVSASDATQISLYGINTGIVPSNVTALSAAEVVAVIACVIVGVVLIANGKFLKRILSK